MGAQTFHHLFAHGVCGLHPILPSRHFFSCHRSLMFRGCCISPTFDDADATCHRHLSAIGCCLLPLVSLGTTTEAEAESPKNLPVTLAAELPIFTFQQRLGYPQLTCFGSAQLPQKYWATSMYCILVQSSCILGVWMFCRTWVFTRW